MFLSCKSCTIAQLLHTSLNYLWVLNASKSRTECLQHKFFPQDFIKLQHLDLTKTLMWIETWFNQIQGTQNMTCQPYSSSFVYLWFSKFGSGPRIPAQHPASNQIIMKLSNSQQEPAARAAFLRLVGHVVTPVCGRHRRCHSKDHLKAVINIYCHFSTLWKNKWMCGRWFVEMQPEPRHPAQTPLHVDRCNFMWRAYKYETYVFCLISDGALTPKMNIMCHHVFKFQLKLSSWTKLSHWILGQNFWYNGIFKHPLTELNLKYRCSMLGTHA